MLNIITSKHSELVENYLLKSCILNRSGSIITNLNIKNKGNKKIVKLNKSKFKDIISNPSKYEDSTIVIYDYHLFITYLTSDLMRKFRQFVCVHRSFNINIFITSNSVSKIERDLKIYCEGYIRIILDDNNKDFTLYYSISENFSEPVLTKRQFDTYDEKFHYSYIEKDNECSFPLSDKEELRININNF